MAVDKKGEEWKEYNNAVRWMSIVAIVSLLITIFFAITAMPLAYLVGKGISADSLEDVKKFLFLTFKLIYIYV